MILIVDSGSTKTDWIGVNEKGDVAFETQTLGLNPQVLDSNIIKERIVNNYDIYRYREQVDKLYFYGAGCGTKPPRALINKVFEETFKLPPVWDGSGQRNLVERTAKELKLELNEDAKSLT